MNNGNSIFDEIFKGGFYESIYSLPKSHEYRKLLTKSMEMEKELQKHLSEDGKVLLEEFFDLKVQLSGYSLDEMFKKGYVVGSRLIMEIFFDPKE